MSKSTRAAIVLATALCVTCLQGPLASDNSSLSDEPIGVYSSLSAANLMRGATQVADPATSTAWEANPAVLAHGRDTKTQTQTIWEAWEQDSVQQDASLDVQVGGDGDFTSLNWVRQNLTTNTGFGAGYSTAETAGGNDIDRYGVGYGMKINQQWTAGISLGVLDPANDDGETVISIGGHSRPTTDVAGRTIAYGAVLRDVTDEIDTQLDVGAAVDLPTGWTVAADLVDLEDLNIGASTRYGSNNNWEVGAGLCDGDLTLGVQRDMQNQTASGAWNVGLSWIDGDNDDIFVANASRSW